MLSIKDGMTDNQDFRVEVSMRFMSQISSDTGDSVCSRQVFRHLIFRSTCAWLWFRPLVTIVWCVMTTQSVSRLNLSLNCAWLCRLASTSPTLSSNSRVTCKGGGAGG